MKKNLTELIFILDRSGSMGGLESDVIGGFNRVLKEHKAMEGEALVTTVLFDHERVVLHDRVPIEKVEPLTDKDYVVRGTTALLDAVGFTLHHVGSIHKYAREEDVPEHTVCVITTDGYENASRAYTAAEVRAMVHKEQEKYGWEFLFLGADIDEVAAAREIGIDDVDCTVRFCRIPSGVSAAFSAIGERARAVRSGERNSK